MNRHKPLEIKRLDKEYNAFSVRAVWTLGKIQTVRSALTIYAHTSPIAQDI